MTIFKKIRELRLYLASVNDSITGEEASKYPKINLFMILDAVLFCVAVAATIISLLFYASIADRYPGIGGVIAAAIPFAIVLFIGTPLSNIADFKKWGNSWIMLGAAYCTLFGVIYAVIKFSLGPEPLMLFYINLFSVHIEVNILLILSYIAAAAWCLNSILMLRYKLHLYRHSFISNSNIPLR